MIINKRSRKRLIEGRTSGMGFAFLKKMLNGNYKTIQPISPCKDYLHEVVFTEHTNIPSRAYGFKHHKSLGLFTDIAHIAITIVPNFHNENSYQYGMCDINKDKEFLSNNREILQHNMNVIEKSMNINPLTTITEENDDMFLVTFSSEWCKSTPSISLFTLLLRVLFTNDKEIDNIIDYLKEYNYDNGDKTIIKSSINNIELIFERGILPPNRFSLMEDLVLRNIQSPHNNGILNGFDGVFEEKPFVKLV